MNPLKSCTITREVKVYLIEYIFDSVTPYKFEVFVTKKKEGKTIVDVISTREDVPALYAATIKQYIETGIIILEKQ